MTLLCEMLVSVRFVLLKKKMKPTISDSTGLSDTLDVLKDRGPDCTETKMRAPSESLSPHCRSTLLGTQLVKLQGLGEKADRSPEVHRGKSRCQMLG